MDKPSINLVCDYIIFRVLDAGEHLNLLKLQKLLYYVQAWHLAFYQEPLFNGKFQAWVHGPVNRPIYDRFSSSHSLYSEVSTSEIQSDLSELSEDNAAHIESVLEAYANFTGSQLEELTHREKPWIDARNGLPSSANCENLIDEKLMQNYYAARLN